MNFELRSINCYEFVGYFWTTARALVQKSRGEDKGVKNEKKLKSKFQMVIGLAGQLAECRAKARS